MLRKVIANNSLLKMSSYKFSSSSHNTSKEPHEEEPVFETKINPDRLKDLRGYENYNDLNENEKSYSAHHSTVTNKSALYYLASFLPIKSSKWIAKFVEHPKSSIASDSLYLPKITPNGIPVYDTIGQVSNYRLINQLITWSPVFCTLMIAHQPFVGVISTIAGYGLYHLIVWKMLTNYVIKMELVPETEEIIYQKLRFLNGQIVSKRVKISDLEHINFTEIYDNGDISERSNRGIYNKELAFRIKSTKELLLFDKSGIWHPEGFKHELLI